VSRLSFSIKRDNQGKTDGDFGRSDGDNEKDKYLAIEVVRESRKCHQGEIRSVQHQLDAHVNHEQISARNNAQQSHGKQQCADCQIVLKGDVHSSVLKQALDARWVGGSARQVRERRAGERPLPPHPLLRQKHYGGQASPLPWGEGDQRLRSFEDEVHGSNAGSSNVEAFYEPMEFDRFCGWSPTQPRSVERKILSNIEALDEISSFQIFFAEQNDADHCHQKHKGNDFERQEILFEQ
jgi:hypothetical protein